MSMNYRGTGLPAILKLDINRDGYARTRLSDRTKFFTVHSLVMLAFVGPRPPGMDIDHINGVRNDNRLENLRYCTTQENCRATHDSGRGNVPFGEHHSLAVLTEEKVREIRRLRKLKFIYSEIAEMMNCDRSTVTRAAKRETWAHVKDEEEA